MGASVSASLGLIWAYFTYNRAEVTIPKVPEKRYSEPLIIPDPVKKNPGNPIILPILLGILLLVVLASFCCFWFMCRPRAEDLPVWDVENPPPRDRGDSRRHH